jgi:hypothetical protein
MLKRGQEPRGRRVRMRFERQWVTVSMVSPGGQHSQDRQTDTRTRTRTRTQLVLANSVDIPDTGVYAVLYGSPFVPNALYTASTLARSKLVDMIDVKAGDIGLRLTRFRLNDRQISSSMRRKAFAQRASTGGPAGSTKKAQSDLLAGELQQLWPEVNLAAMRSR